MDAIKRAREALERSVTAAVRGFEENFPDAVVESLIVYTESPPIGADPADKRTKKVEAHVRLV